VRILLVEDEPGLARIVARRLVEHGHEVEAVGTGTAAVKAAMGGRFDVAILDWMVPDMDGIAVLHAWRGAGVAMPVIMVTGKGATDEKVTGLRAGADDYLAKPFEFEELLARIEALHRRGVLAGPVQVGRVLVDPRRRTVSVGEASEKLTERELELLLELVKHPGQPLSRAHLIDVVWRGEPVHPKVVDVYVGYLRAKLDRLPSPGLSIGSERKVGFRLDITV
jgi:DNA-binding response OmpR family regulator